MTSLGQIISRACLALAGSAALSGCGMLESGLDPGWVDPAVKLSRPAEAAAGTVLSDSYIVAFRSPPESAQFGFASYRSEYQYHWAFLAERFVSDPEISEMHYLTRMDLSRLSKVEPDQGFFGPGAGLYFTEPDREPAPAMFVQVDFRDYLAARRKLNQWHEQGLIYYADPNYLSYPMVQQSRFEELATTYEGGSVWWHGIIRLVSAFRELNERTIPPAQNDDEIENNPPVIAVLDSGFDSDHIAFQDSRWENPVQGKAGCGKNDQFGCNTTITAKGQLGAGSAVPYFTEKPGEPCPPQPGPGSNPIDVDRERNCVHGTHVAGIIAGLDSNSGVYGVCPVCKILPIRIIRKNGDKGAAPDSAILNGLTYVTRFKRSGSSRNLVRVVNSSFGKYARSRAVALMVSILFKDFNVVVVGAASNEDSMSRAYPAALNDAIAVAAVNDNARKASYSNYGPWVDIAAPGGESADRGLPIQSASPGGDARGKAGTSMASPVVAGALGLMFAQFPNLSASAARSTLLNSADCGGLYNSDDNGEYNRRYFYQIEGESAPRPLLGSGMLNLSTFLKQETGEACSTAGLDRVGAGCAIGSRSEAGTSSWIWLFLMFGPLGMWLLSSRGLHRDLTVHQRG